jgi:hypothetical protein
LFFFCVVLLRVYVLSFVLWCFERTWWRLFQKHVMCSKKVLFMSHSVKESFILWHIGTLVIITEGRRCRPGRDRMVVGFTTTCTLVPITTKVVSLNPVHGEVYSIQVCQWLATGRWFSAGTSISSTIKTDRHDITEILMKVTLKLNQTEGIFHVWYSSLRSILEPIPPWSKGNDYYIYRRSIDYLIH